MGIIRPATPGFLITLTATIILAVVSFSVPYFKSVYFLKASISQGDVKGSVIFGVLGYCLELPGNTTCSKASVGYELDINNLVGNTLPIEIPSVVVKWITYALVLHIVALGLAAVSAVFGLLAHVREMSMACCSTCISGFAASIALLAFIFDLVLFFVAKARINKVDGGAAEIGTGIWLTLAAWILLFFSGCFFGIGRCCVRRRPRKEYDDKRGDDRPFGGLGRSNRDEEMRLDAVKAEADRKAAAKRGEIGLPAFSEQDHEQSTPLKARIDGDSVYVEDDQAQPYRDQPASPPQKQYPGGYVPGATGGRTIDEYNHGPQRQPSGQTTTTYPPQAHPQRQGSGHSNAAGYFPPANVGYAGAAAVAGAAGAAAVTSPTHYGGGVTSPNQYGAGVTSPGQYGAGAAAPSQYLAAGAYGGHQQYPSGTSYHTSATHQQQPTADYGNGYYDPYSQPYAQPGPQQGYQPEPGFNPDTYNQTAMMMPASHTPPFGQRAPASEYYTPNSEPQSYYGAHPTGVVAGAAAAAHSTPDRAYTLGGSGYGNNVVPPLNDSPSPAPSTPSYLPYPGEQRSPSHYTPSPIDTAAARTVVSPVGPRNPTSPTRQMSSPTGMEESPPGYDGPLGGGSAAPSWDVKR